jgi:hypothetical protein
MIVSASVHSIRSFGLILRLTAILHPSFSSSSSSSSTSTSISTAKRKEIYELLSRLDVQVEFLLLLLLPPPLSLPSSLPFFLPFPPLLFFLRRSSTKHHLVFWPSFSSLDDSLLHSRTILGIVNFFPFPLCLLRLFSFPFFIYSFLVLPLPRIPHSASRFVVVFDSIGPLGYLSSH